MIRDRKKCAVVHSCKRLGGGGFGLLEVIVASGIMAILIAAAASFFSGSLKTHAFTKMQSQVDAFHEETRALLSSHVACTNTFIGTPLSPGTTHSVTQLKDEKNVVTFKLGMPYGDRSFDITALEFSDYSDKTYPSGEGVLTMRFASANKEINGPAALSRTIRLETRKDSSGKLVDCIAMAKMSDGIWRMSPGNTSDIFYKGGNVGIGNSNPTWSLQVDTNNQDEDDGITLNHFSNSGVGSLRMMRMRGTSTAPLRVESGDELGSVVFSGYWTGKPQPGYTRGEGDWRGAIRAFATEPWSSSSTNGMSLAFAVTPNGSGMPKTAVTISQNTNVGIGTDAPADKLHVVGDLRVEGCVKDSGSSYVAGTCASDERLKQDIHPLGPIAERLAKVIPAYFHWKSEPEAEQSLGLIAQQTQKVFPELVEDGDIKKVRYSRIPIFLLQAFREQQLEIAELKDRVRKLEEGNRANR